jgi:hypothetical protein
MGTPVQSSGKLETATGGTTITFNMPGNFTNGNWAVLRFIATTANLAGLTIGGVTPNNDQFDFPFGPLCCGIVSGQMTGGSSAIVFTYSAGAANMVTCWCDEWNDFQTATPLDQAPAPVNSSNPTVTTATLSQANERIFAMGGCENLSSGASGPTSGYAQDLLETGGTFFNAASGWKDVASTTAVSATWSTSSGRIDGLVATYRISAGGGGDTLFGQACY